MPLLCVSRRRLRTALVALPASVLALFAAAGERAGRDFGNRSPNVLVILDSGASMTHDADTNSLMFLAAGDDDGWYSDLVESWYGPTYLDTLLGPGYRDVLDRGSKLAQAQRALTTLFTAGYDFNWGFTFFEKLDLEIGYVNAVYEVSELVDSDDDGIPDTPQPPMLDGSLPGTPLRFGGSDDLRNPIPAEPFYPVRFGEDGDQVFVEEADPFGTNSGTPQAPMAGDLRLAAELVNGRDPVLARPLAMMTENERRAEHMYYFPAYWWGEADPGSTGLSWSRLVREGLEGLVTWEDVAVHNGIDTGDPGWQETVRSYALEDILKQGDPWGLPLGTLTESNQIGSEVLFVRERFEVYVAGLGWQEVDTGSCPLCPPSQVTEVVYRQSFVLYDHEPTEVSPSIATLSAAAYQAAADCSGYLDPAGDHVPVVPFAVPDPVTGTTNDSSGQVLRLLDPQPTPSFYFPHHPARFLPAGRVSWLPFTETVVAAGRRPLSASINEAHQYFDQEVTVWVDPYSFCRPSAVVVVVDGNESCSSPLAPCVAATNIGVPVHLVYFGTDANLQGLDPVTFECVAVESGGSYATAASEAELTTVLLAIADGIDEWAVQGVDIGIDPPDPTELDEITLDAVYSDGFGCFVGPNSQLDWSISGATSYEGCAAAPSCAVPAGALSPGPHTVTLTVDNLATSERWVAETPLSIRDSTGLFADGFEAGDTGAWSLTAP